ncbi:MAG: hypothetical protein ACKO1W_00585 [Microcystaceae cyanobacterium]
MILVYFATVWTVIAVNLAQISGKPHSFIKQSVSSLVFPVTIQRLGVGCPARSHRYHNC